MRNGILTYGIAVLTAATLIVGENSNAFAGEKKRLSYSKTARETIVETKMGAGGIPGRELIQGIYRDTHKSPDKEFDGSEARVYNQDENGPDGVGVHRGFEVDFLKQGDQLFQRYEGTHKITTLANGNWEAIYQGESQIIGGTGKFKNARGRLSYKGRITPDSFSEEDIGEIEY